MEDGREQLADWIVRCHLTQRNAAVKLGLHFTTLNKILSGCRRPGLSIAIQLQRLAGVPVEAWTPTGDGKCAITRRKHSQKRANWQVGNRHAR